MGITTTQNSTTALSSAVKGLQESEQRFSKAANDVVKTYAAAANVVSGASSGEPLSAETLAAANDPVTPLVDMKTSQRAYEANLAVLSTINEMEQSLMDVLA